MVCGWASVRFVKGAIPYLTSGGQSRRWRRPHMRRVLSETFDRRDHCRVRAPDRRDDFIWRPAAAERLIERHKTIAGKPNDFGALLLQGELLPFGVQHIEEVGQAAIVTFRRHASCLTGGLEREVKAAHALPEGLIGGI